MNFGPSVKIFTKDADYLLIAKRLIDRELLKKRALWHNITVGPDPEIVFLNFVNEFSVESLEIPSYGNVKVWRKAIAYSSESTENGVFSIVYSVACLPTAAYLS